MPHGDPQRLRHWRGEGLRPGPRGGPAHATRKHEEPVRRVRHTRQRLLRTQRRKQVGFCRFFVKKRHAISRLCFK